MNKIILTFSIVLISAICSQAQNPSDTVQTRTIFPDSLFRKELFKQLDKDGDKKILWSEVWKKNSFSIDGIAIKSLKGIEVFTNLDTLKLEGLSLTKLDLSANDKMVYLYVPRQRSLTSVIVSKKAPYQVIECNDNGLTSFDASSLKSLKKLTLGAQKLTYLNIQGTNLNILKAIENPKLTVCVDSELQWNAISTNELRSCQLNNPNASYCQYELACIILTSIDKENSASSNTDEHVDYDFLGRELPATHNQKTVIRYYENGTHKKIHFFDK